jgi:transposase-like protein
MSASRFTPEVRSALVEHTAEGLPLADACRVEGLRLNTVKGWLQRGRQEREGPYAHFDRAIREARKAARDRPTPMDADELPRVVSEKARKGSVQAAIRGLNAKNAARATKRRSQKIGRCPENPSKPIHLLHRHSRQSL